MPDDPLMQFVNGNYEKSKRSHAKFSLAALLLLWMFFFVASGWMCVDAVGRLGPLNPTMEAQGIIKSKSHRAGRGLFGHRRFVINYYYPIESNPEQQNIFNGYHSASWLYYRQVEVGDVVTVKFNPSEKDHGKRSYVQGARPVMRIGLQYFIGLFFLVLSVYILRLFLQRKGASNKWAIR